MISREMDPSPKAQHDVEETLELQPESPLFQDAEDAQGSFQAGMQGVGRVQTGAEGLDDSLAQQEVVEFSSLVRGPGHGADTDSLA